jgi:hypothetical protein
MLQKLNVRAEDIPRTKFRLHIITGVLILLTFILAIVRIADSGTPRGRTNTWGIAVVSSNLPENAKTAQVCIAN